MAGGRFLTTCTPKYSEIGKVIAPFGTTLDCVMWCGAKGTRHMAQSTDLIDNIHITAYRLHLPFFMHNYDILHLNSKIMTFAGVAGRQPSFDRFTRLESGAVSHK